MVFIITSIIVVDDDDVVTVIIRMLGSFIKTLTERNYLRGKIQTPCQKNNRNSGTSSTR